MLMFSRECTLAHVPLLVFDPLLSTLMLLLTDLLDPCAFVSLRLFFCNIYLFENPIIHQYGVVISGSCPGQIRMDTCRFLVFTVIFERVYFFGPTYGLRFYKDLIAMPRR